MNTPETTPAPLWPLVLYVAAVVATAAGMLALSWVLGQRHRERATGIPYESGLPSTGSARLRFSADFYLVAMFFVVFDLESVFVLAWAVAVRDLGWAGFAAVSWFITVLVAALVYLWKTGALDWGPRRGPAAPDSDASPPGETPTSDQVPATLRSRLGDDALASGEPRADA